MVAFLKAGPRFASEPSEFDDEQAEWMTDVNGRRENTEACPTFEVEALESKSD